MERDQKDNQRTGEYCHNTEYLVGTAAYYVLSSVDQTPHSPCRSGAANPQYEVIIVYTVYALYHHGYNSLSPARDRVTAVKEKTEALTASSHPTPYY